jgi:hypothetical protein
MSTKYFLSTPLVITQVISYLIKNHVTTIKGATVYQVLDWSKSNYSGAKVYQTLGGCLRI